MITRICEFSYVGTRAFSGDGDELRLSNGVLYGDCMLDGFADFAINLNGITRLNAADFLF